MIMSGKRESSDLGISSFREFLETVLYCMTNVFMSYVWLLFICVYKKLGLFTSDFVENKNIVYQLYPNIYNMDTRKSARIWPARI